MRGVEGDIACKRERSSVVHSSLESVIFVCQKRGGKTGNNTADLHKDPLWVSAGRIMGEIACRQYNVVRVLTANGS